MESHFLLHCDLYRLEHAELTKMHVENVLSDANKWVMSSIEKHATEAVRNYINNMFNCLTKMSSIILVNS